MAVKTFTTGEVLTAADTNTYLANSGLVYISDTAFTASSAVNVSSVFSSTFDNYRLVITWLQNTSNANLTMKLRDSGGDISTNYGSDMAGQYYNSGVFTFAGYNNTANETQTSIFVGNVVSTHYGQTAYDIFSPNLARPTVGQGVFYTSNASATLTRVTTFASFRHTASTACTGFSLIPSAGTITGKVQLYGYRQA